jgi:capsular exopolysaccharide synthesis family protein
MKARYSTKSSTELGLSDYAVVIRLRKWSILAILVITVGVAILLTSGQEVTYTSEAKVLVKPASVAPAAPLEGEAVNIETEKELAQSDQVTSRAARKLGLSVLPDGFVAGLDVEGTEDIEILTFRYTSSDASTAQQTAAAFATAYLEFRSNQVADDLTVATDELRRRAALAKQRLAQVNRDLAAATAESQIATLTATADLVFRQISDIKTQLVTLTSPEILNIGNLVQPASLAEGSEPNILRNGILAGIIGLLLGVGLALFRDGLDGRPRNRQELESDAEAPMLAAVPFIKSWRRRESTLLVSLMDPESPAAEAYRSLRTNVLYAASHRKVKTLLVTSPKPGEGKSATVANLAVSLAQAQKKVAVVCADLRRPRLQHFFRSRTWPGLTEVLTGDSTLADAMAWSGVPGLHFLPSGRSPSNPAELVGSEKMAMVIARLAKENDIVLIDAPPLLSIADASTMGSVVDGVLMVVDAQSTTRSEIEQSAIQLDQVGANILGVILNKFDPRRAWVRSYHYYGYTADQPRSANGLAIADKLVVQTDVENDTTRLSV